MSLCGKLTREQSNRLYLQVLADKDDAAMRKLCQEDLFFLLTVGCNRKDINRDWLYERCREVEASPDGHLDLWAREHYKSTIITFGKTIQDILKNPEITVGIFSHTRPIAKAFLAQIKVELETNTFLKDLFPDVLYANPQKDSPTWSLDNGIIVKRKSNPKEKTIEAWGLVDGQPISKHYSLLIYDDVVTRESITTPEQIQKTTEAWELSLALGANGGSRRMIGTRYHMNDTYREIIKRGSATTREYAATHDGTDTGKPVFLDPKTLLEKRRDMGPYTFAAQMLQNPTADKAMGFKREWLRHYDTVSTQGMNLYLLCDPAGEKKKGSDYTVIMVIGLNVDNNYYLIDAIRSRLNLTARTKALFSMHRKHPGILATGYEKYGKDSDIEHIKDEMDRQNYHFEITALGGPMPKPDRIRRLVPLFEQGRFYLPHRLMFIDEEDQLRDFVREFIEDEYSSFPVSVHDDMLDDMARITDEDLAAVFPTIDEQAARYPGVAVNDNQAYDPYREM